MWPVDWPTSGENWQETGNRPRAVFRDGKPVTEQAVMCCRTRCTYYRYGWARLYEDIECFQMKSGPKTARKINRTHDIERKVAAQTEDDLGCYWSMYIIWRTVRWKEGRHTAEVDGGKRRNWRRRPIKTMPLILNFSTDMKSQKWINSWEENMQMIWE